jgi:hypothetical protein
MPADSPVASDSATKASKMGSVSKPDGPDLATETPVTTQTTRTAPTQTDASETTRRNVGLGGRASRGRGGSESELVDDFFAISGLSARGARTTKTLFFSSVCKFELALERKEERVALGCQLIGMALPVVRLASNSEKKLIQIFIRTHKQNKINKQTNKQTKQTNKQTNKNLVTEKSANSSNPFLTHTIILRRRAQLLFNYSFN